MNCVPGPKVLRQNIFAALAGAYVGLSLLKFGNPAILDHLIAPPSGLL